MACPLPIFSQSEYLIQAVDINSHTQWQTVQIQKPNDLDLTGFSRTRVKKVENWHSLSTCTGERILEYALAFDLLLGNTCFKKQDSHLITYKSGNIATHIDFILFCRIMRKLVTDVKVIPGEEVALQHQLLVCDMRIDVHPKSKRKFTPRLKVWKHKDPQTSNHFQEVFNLHVSTSAGVADGAIEDIWNNIKSGLLKTTEEVCGTTRSHRWHRETWWWNEHVEKAIAAQRTAFKARKAGKGTRASYDAAKRNARHAVHHARQEADKKVYENIDPKSSEVYRLANQLRTSKLEERTLMLLVTNLWRMMQERCQWAKTQSRRPGWSTTKGFSMLSLTGTQTTCHINHQWKARPSQSPLIWLRRLSHRWRQAKHRAHQA